MKKVLLALCAGVALCASAEVFEKGTAYTYPINPDFHYFDNSEDLAEMNINWPTLMMEDGCSFGSATEAAFGTMAVWFNNGEAQPVTVAAADALCPVVEDPWNAGSYALKMQAPIWWGFGNFNCAMPNTSELCRVRAIFRCDTEGASDERKTNDKGILFRLTNADLAGDADGVPGPNAKVEIPAIWEHPELYRVVDLYTNQLDGKTYFAITFMPGGFSCGGNQPAFYLEEVSIVPVKLLAGDTHVAGDVVIDTPAVRPALVEVAGINSSIKEVNAAVKAGNVIYDMQGRRVAAATKGMYIINGKKALVK